jgi:hypothetical protein
MMFFWVNTLCGLVGTSNRFGEVRYLHLRPRRWKVQRQAFREERIYIYTHIYIFPNLFPTKTMHSASCPGSEFGACTIRKETSAGILQSPTCIYCRSSIT